MIVPSSRLAFFRARRCADCRLLTPRGGPCADLWRRAGGTTTAGLFC